MDALDRVTGIRCQDGASVKRLFRFALVVPDLPQSGETERLVIGCGDVDGLLGSFLALLLVEAVRRYQAPPLPEGVPEGGLGIHGFRSGIDHPAADGGVIRPEGHQPPFELPQNVFAVLPYDGGDHLDGCHVVVL